MVLGLYPIVELTRVIIYSGKFYYPAMVTFHFISGEMGYYTEITVMWILYLSIIPIGLLFFKYIEILLHPVC